MELIRFQLSDSDKEQIKKRISCKSVLADKKTKFVFMIQAIVDDEFNVTGVFGDCVTGETAIKITELLHEYYK